MHIPCWDQLFLAFCLQPCTLAHQHIVHTITYHILHLVLLLLGPFNMLFTSNKFLDTLHLYIWLFTTILNSCYQSFTFNLWFSLLKNCHGTILLGNSSTHVVHTQNSTYRIENWLSIIFNQMFLASRQNTRQNTSQRHTIHKVVHLMLVSFLTSLIL